MEKRRVREKDLYLKAHGLTTIGRKPVQQNKKIVDANELSTDQDVVKPENEEYPNVTRTRATMILFLRLWMNRQSFDN